MMNDGIALGVDWAWAEQVL